MSDMTDSNHTELRIYCICGQKMRVHEEMYGKPGRCVACRQKIWIPKKEEIPEGITEIFLKDHPELLRKKSSSDQEKSEVLGDSSSEENLADMPLLDVFPLENSEFLQLLISVEYKAQRYLKGLRDKKPLGKETKTELLEILSKVRRLRGEFDEKLKLRRRDILEQIKQVESEIGKLVIAFRTGEIDFRTYWREVTPLRVRRERLFMRRRNVEGWLSTITPEMAGGYIEVEFSRIPTSVPDVVFTLEDDQEESLIQFLIRHLENVLDLRESAERQLKEWKTLVDNKKVNIEMGQKILHECEIKLKYAVNAIHFFRERLEQLISDYELDLESIEKNLVRISKKVEAGVLDRNLAQQMETELYKARLDISRSRDTARRAISANSRMDIPSLQGTYIARMRADRGVVDIGADSWLSWITATLMVMLIMIPMTQAQGLVTNFRLVIMVIGLLLSAICVATIGSFPKRTWRGIGLNIVWVIFVLVFTLHLNLVWYSLTPIGGYYRSSNYGFFSFGVISTYAVLSLLGLSAWLTFTKKKNLLWIPILATIVNVAVVLTINTDVFGLMLGKAELGTIEIQEYDNSTGAYKVHVPIHNEGNRSVYFGDSLLRVHSPVFVKVTDISEPEKEIHPKMFINSKSEQIPIESAFNKPEGKIGPKDFVKILYHLPPSSYTFELVGKGKHFVSQKVTLELHKQNSDSSPSKTELSENKATVPDEGKNTNGVIFKNTLGNVFAEARGNENEQYKDNLHKDSVFTEMDSADNELSDGEAIIYFSGFGQQTTTEGNHSPKFRVTITTKSKKLDERFVELGSKIIGEWEISEFSPQRETITLKYNNNFYIAKVGKKYKIRF